MGIQEPELSPEAGEVQVGLWAGTGRAVTAARERRLREAGLIEVVPGVGGSGRLLICKRGGLRAVGREELATPRLSAATVHHSSITARVGVGLERAGHRVLSEREIEARERAEGKRIYSASQRYGGFHRPDLVVLPSSTSEESASDWGWAWPSSSRTQGGGRRECTEVHGQALRTEDKEIRSATHVTQPIAIEVELTDKAARRLDALLRAWRLAVAGRQFSRVRYLCSPRALPYVERAVVRTATAAAIEVALLGVLTGHSP